MIADQGKRSAALGKPTKKIYPSPFLFGAPAARQTEKGEGYCEGA